MPASWQARISGLDGFHRSSPDCVVRYRRVKAGKTLLATQAYGALRDVKLARGLPRGGSETRPDKTQTSATIVAIAASTASEWRTNFEAAIAITNSKIRAVQVMPL